MIRRILIFSLIAPLTWIGAIERPVIEFPSFHTIEEELSWIIRELGEKAAEKERHKDRVKYYTREAERLLFKDYGYARLYYRRASRAENRAKEAQQEIEALEARRSKLSETSR